MLEINQKNLSTGYTPSKRPRNNNKNNGNKVGKNKVRKRFSF